MKNLPALKLLLFISTITIWMSCQKDEDIFIQQPNELYTTSIFGSVVDELDDPIVGALVSYRGHTTETDVFGTYSFTEVLVDSRYNHLNIEKDGYFKHTRTFRSSISNPIVQKSKLLPQEINQSITSQVPSTISEGPIQIEFLSGEMVFDGTTQSYDGKVDVAMVYLDPLDERLHEIMPGDLSGINSDDAFKLLETFGMIGVELRSEDNRKLQLAQGSQARISIDIPSEIASKAPEKIPLWHFDHDLGLWVEEGEAVRNGSQYIGTVNHFSFWNFDVQRDVVHIQGRIIDQNDIGVGGVALKITRPNERRGASGITDFEGYFSGPVEKGVPLSIQITTNCGGEEVIFFKEIGPFENDTEISDISIDLPNVSYLDVDAEFLTCDGQILENGLLKISDHDRPEYFPIIDGKLQTRFGFCGTDNVTLEVIDRNNLNQLTLGTYDLPGQATFDQVKVCGDIVNFASINSPSLGLELILVDSVSFAMIGVNKSILAFDYSFEQVTLEIKYVDQEESTIEIGTHDILKMVCNYTMQGTAFEVVLLLEDGTITINEVDEGLRMVKGEYEFEAVIDVLEEKHTFFGEFVSNY